MTPRKEETPTEPAFVIGDEQSDDYHEEGDEEEQTNVFIDEPSSSSSSSLHGRQVMDRDEKGSVTNAQEREQVEQEEKRAVMMAAGLLTGLLGCFFCGPVAGCAMGAGAAIGTARPTHAGNMARSIGHCALSCTRCSRQKVMAVNEQHQVATRLQEATLPYQQSRAVLTMKATVAEHPVTIQTQAAAASTWQGAQNLNERYRLADRSWDGIHSALDMMHGVVMGEKPGTSSDSITMVASSTSSSSSASDFSIVDEDADDDNHNGQQEEPHKVAAKKVGGYAAVHQTEQMVE